MSNTHTTLVIADIRLTRDNAHEINPMLNRAGLPTLAGARTMNDYAKGLTRAQRLTLGTVFTLRASTEKVAPARKATARKPVARKVQPVVSKKRTVKAASKPASKAFTCGCTGIKQHLSATNGCGVAAERKAAKANA